MNIDFAEKISKEKKLTEFKNNIASFAEDLKNNKDIIHKLDDDELQILYEYRNPYVKKLPLSSDNDNTYNCMSFTTLQKEYESKLHITGFVGFLHRRLKEYIINENDLTKKIDDKQFIERVDVVDEDSRKRFYEKHYF